MAERGIHAVLLVLSVKTCVSQEKESTLNTLQCKILNYFIVVFTGGDEFEEDNQTLDDYFSAGCPESLKNVLKLCGQRKVLFDNKTTDKDKEEEKLKQLLAHIADVGKQTGGKPYTYQMHHQLKEENDEKVREQEREIESKNRAEAEQAVMQGKYLRMDQEMIALAEANEKLIEQQRAIAKYREETELAVMQAKLRIEQEKLQMEKEKMKQLIRHAEEEKKLMEQQMNERKKVAVSRVDQICHLLNLCLICCVT